MLVTVKNLAATCHDQIRSFGSFGAESTRAPIHAPIRPLQSSLIPPSSIQRRVVHRDPLFGAFIAKTQKAVDDATAGTLALYPSISELLRSIFFLPQVESHHSTGASAHHVSLEISTLDLDGEYHHHLMEPDWHLSLGLHED